MQVSGFVGRWKQHFALSMHIPTKEYRASKVFYKRIHDALRNRCEWPLALFK